MRKAHLVYSSGQPSRRHVRAPLAPRKAARHGTRRRVGWVSAARIRPPFLAEV